MSNNKRKQYSVQDEIERKERIVEDSNAEAYKLCCKELLDSSSTAEEYIDSLSNIDLKESVESKVLDNTPSLDRVMKAIERAEDRGRMNSKHIHTLQQAVNTLSYHLIEY